MKADVTSLETCSNLTGDFQQLHARLVGLKGHQNETPAQSCAPLWFHHPWPAHVYVRIMVCGFAYVYLGVKKGSFSSKSVKPLKSIFYNPGVCEGFSLSSAHGCKLLPEDSFRDKSGARGNSPEEWFRMCVVLCVCQNPVYRLNLCWSLHPLKLGDLKHVTIRTTW